MTEISIDCSQKTINQAQDLRRLAMRDRKWRERGLDHWRSRVDHYLWMYQASHTDFSLHRLQQCQAAVAALLNQGMVHDR